MNQNEASMAEMDMAMGRGRYAQDDQLHVEFYYKPRIDAAKTAKAGHPVHTDVLYARITPPGGSTVDQPVNELTEKRFAERLKRWRANRDNHEAVEGFRLEEWAAITRSEAENLKYHKIFTVEQLAETPDGNLQGMMGGMGLKQKAQAWIEENHGTDAKLKEMAARIAELEAEQNKPRRGRPPKTEE